MRLMLAGLCAFLLAASAGADVKLPALLSDGVVLPREREAAVWGWANRGEVVRVTPSWGGEPVETTTGPDGAWRVMVKTPRAGGPYSIEVKGDTTRIIRDVMIGEVWVCSGQSNMEWPLAAIGPGRAGVPSADEEIANATQPKVRLFTVPNRLSAHERQDAEGAAWRACTPQTARDFSAVGYFFAREMVLQLDVPVGVISADWGGTPAESWMSRDALEAFGEFSAGLETLKELSDPATRGNASERGRERWWRGLDGRKGGPGRGWQNLTFDDAGWKVMQLPATLSADGLGSYDGAVHFRLVVDVPAAKAGAGAVLSLGPIDDRDEAFVNGELVGTTREDGAWSRARKYPVRAGLLQAGKNIVAVRMIDTAGPGGINGKPEQMALEFEDGSRVELAGEWKYAAGPAMAELRGIDGPVEIGAGMPSVLYAGMIAPLTPMTVSGVLWYQGESNVGRGEQYARLFPALLENWRGKFGQKDLPFHFVQIAPFNYGDGDAAARLREAQAKALALPRTGMVCTLDLGNPRDIHPDNKQEVGRRLALSVLRGVHGMDVAASGPVFRELAAPPKGAMRLKFDTKGGGGLVGRGAAAGFVIAGEDRQFHEAQAEIDGDTVIVRSGAVSNPVAVRYAWSASPTAWLYNESGLPAAPFRTDDWEGPLPPVKDAGKTVHHGEDAGLKPIFNGKDLTGWINVNTGPSTWKVRGGMIVCSGVPTGVLRTEKMYENFVMEMEFRHMVPGGNAGLFVWSDALPARGVPFTRSVEVQVMDGREADWYTSDGDIFPIHGARMTPENGRGGDRAFPTEKRMNPSPMWNHYRVECVNGEISLAVNGKVVTRGRDVSPRKGYICLEAEGSEIHFRNIRVKELPASGSLEEGQIAKADEGHTALFNGENFDGWKFGPAHEGHWKINDWVLAFDGQGEDLWTKEEFGDFELIVDWRWPEEAKAADLPVILPDGNEKKDEAGKTVTQRVMEAGDSGIYLRGSSKSQVNIWCWPIGSGEVYGYRTDGGMPAEVRAAVTPRLNADAKIGGWNRFIITMRGENLTVVLNGKTVIENARLPGVAAKGPIGLQMHHSAIEFANIFVKRLDEE